MSHRASTTGTQQAYHLQTDTDGSPQSVVRVLSPAMSQAGSQTGGGGANLLRRPIFDPQNADRPTNDELTAYIGAVEWHIDRMEFLLDFLGDSRDDRPPKPSSVTTSQTPMAIWRCAQAISEEMALYEKYVDLIKIQTAQIENQGLRQASASAQPQSSGGSFKTPLPTKYEGKKGDSADTFLVACNNYRVMRPNAFMDEAQFI